MGDALTRVDRHLLGAIGGCRRGGEDFANPVWSELKRRRVGELGHAFAAPAGEIGHEYVAMKMKLGFIENDPTAGTTFAAVEGAIKLAAE